MGVAGTIRRPAAARPRLGTPEVEVGICLGTGGIAAGGVDVFAAFGTATGQYDSTWYADGLHPNQSGYNRLRDRIYASMKGSNPPALPANP